MKTKLLLLLAVFVTAFSVNAQTIAIVGEAAGGWPGDPGNPGPADVHQMTSTDGINWTLSDLTLTTAASGGGVKFRQDNAWAINWGAASFPTGTGTQGGANILCIAGTYDVTFNSVTGEYNFSGGVPIPVVKIVGTAVTGGMVSMSATSPTTFTLPTTTFLEGNAQFEVDGVLYGGTGFPSGNAPDATAFVPVIAGEYTSVTLDLGTGDYVFTAAPVFPTIAIVGTGAGGWPGEAGNPGPVDVNQMTTSNGETYKLNVIALTAADIKFRQNNAWDVSWGGLSFPTGPTDGSQNIAVTAAGTYRSIFTRSTGAYVFDFPTVAIVGEAVGGWPGEAGNPGPADINQLTTTDGETYTISNLVVTTAASGGGAKFRYDNTWSDVNSGGTSFPTATSSTGDNIPTVAGTYDVTFTRSTGAYNFGPALATTSFAKSNLKVFPNPSNTNWNFTSSKEIITSIQVIDMLGKVVATSASTTVDASALTTGVYFAKVATATATETIKVVKN
jgi:starch-binding outer membrane protein SusE/F